VRISATAVSSHSHHLKSPGFRKMPLFWEAPRRPGSTSISSLFCAAQYSADGVSICRALARPLFTARNCADGVSKVRIFVLGKKRLARSAICGLFRLAIVYLS
jgi:hypothetical protein